MALKARVFGFHVRPTTPRPRSMSLGCPKPLARIGAGLQDHLILLVCKTISSSWSARPLVHQSYLPADHDALVRTVAGLQDHLIFLVCKTISSSWSARPVVHQIISSCRSWCSLRGGGGSQRQPPSSSHVLVGRRTFGQVFLSGQFLAVARMFAQKKSA